MIKSLKVITNGEPTLEELLPKGLVIDTDSPYVMITGDNGSGKTALLRLLNNSLLSNEFYSNSGKNKLSVQLWQACHKTSYADKKIMPNIKNDMEYITLTKEKIKIMEMHRELFPDFELHLDTLIDPSERIEELRKEYIKDRPAIKKEDFYKFAMYAAEWLMGLSPEEIKSLDSYSYNIDRKKRREELTQFARNKEKNDPVSDYLMNYLLETMMTGKSVSYESWDNKINDISSHGSLSMYLFNQPKIMYKEKIKDIIQRLEKKFSEDTDSKDSRWVHLAADIDSPIYGMDFCPSFSVRERMTGLRIFPFLEFMPLLTDSDKISSGNYVMHTFEGYKREIGRFFKEGKRYTPEYAKDNSKISIAEKMAAIFVSDIPEEFRENLGGLGISNVPKDAGMALLADEPDAYLDGKNQQKLSNDLFGLHDQYPKFQLFVSSNNPSFINAAPEGTIFVVCDRNGPIQTTRKNPYK